MKINRRKFIAKSLSTGASLVLMPTLPGLFLKSALAGGGSPAHSTDDPHFFLMITLPDPSSCDSSYLFDARPLEMTQNNVIQNYRTTGEPTAWTGANGVITLATDIAQPLQRLKQYFTVINGVTMATGFDGHDQNFNYLFAGDPFGGECFVPHLNLSGTPCALDAIQRGRVKATLSNVAKTVPLGPVSGAALVQRLAAVSALNPSTSLFQHLQSRFSAVGNTTASGSLSLGSSAMSGAFNGAPALSQMISSLKITGPDTDENFIPMIAQFFKAGAARAAILTLDTKQKIYDTHDVVSATAQPAAYATLVDTLSQVLDQLRNTPYDDTRSLMDVTTFLFSAEFSRTLRQYGLPITATGTDHNTFANSLLIGGKGIRCGQVIGATDFMSSTEVLSGAHLSLDPAKNKLLGKPFDFTTGLSRSDLPAAFSQSDYLGFNSVINTIYQSFNVPTTKWRLIERNGAVAPVVSSLLQS